MPQIIYNGVVLLPISEMTLSYNTIMDPSETDHVYTTVDVEGQFEVCGQVEMAGMDDPPTSYQEEEGSAPVKGDDDLPIRAGKFFKLATNTDGPERQKGAVAETNTLHAAPYASGVKSKAYAAENRLNRKIKFAPASPVVTWNLIWPRLKQPRGRLIVFEGDGASENELLVMSPAFGRHCDAKNGPFPTIMGMTQAQGDDPTYYVNWACKTYLSSKERKLPILGTTLAEDTSPLLSNRWTMRHEVANGGYTNIHVKGMAVFDVGMLHLIGDNPDVYRNALMLPVPLGFERRDLQVTCSPDMTSLTYEFIDVQVPVMFPAGTYENVVEFEGTHQQYINCEKDIVKAAYKAAMDLLNIKWMIRAGFSNS